MQIEIVKRLKKANIGDDVIADITGIDSSKLKDLN